MIRFAQTLDRACQTAHVIMGMSYIILIAILLTTVKQKMGAVTKFVHIRIQVYRIVLVLLDITLLETLVLLYLTIIAFKTMDFARKFALTLDQIHQYAHVTMVILYLEIAVFQSITALRKMVAVHRYAPTRVPDWHRVRVMLVMIHFTVHVIIAQIIIVSIIMETVNKCVIIWSHTVRLALARVVTYYIRTIIARQ